MLILSVDHLAHRYGCLPTEALERGTTFDLEVLNTSVLWEEYKYKKQNGKLPKAPVKEHTQEELQAMVAAVKKQKKKR